MCIRDRFGVTTVVGCLGTDGIGRDMCALVAKTKGLNAVSYTHLDVYKRQNMP